MLTSFGETRNKRQCVTLYKFYKAASNGVSPFGENNVLYFGNSVPNSLLNLRK